MFFFFFSSRRRHTRWNCDWSSDVCSSDLVCPRMYVPQQADSVDLCLVRGDLWDRQSGDVINPDPSVLCTHYPTCVTDTAFALGSAARVGRVHYPEGRYSY